MADYTEDQLFAKLERADAAGDSEAAKAIADEIRRVQGMAAKPAANNSDFARLITGKPKESRPATYNFTGIPGVSTQIGGALDAVQHHGMNALHGAAQFVSHGLGLDSAKRDDAALAKREADYQARTKGNAGSYVGAAVGEVLPWMYGVGELRAAGLLPKVTATGAKGAAIKGGLLAAEGGLMGLTSPVTEKGDYGKQKAGQVVTGAVASPLTVAGLRGLTGAAQGVAGVVRQAVMPGAVAQGGLAGIVSPTAENIAALRGYREFVPGETPSVAQVLSGNGDPALMQAERALRGTPEGANAFGQQDYANNQAINAVVGKLAGTDAELAAAQQGKREVGDFWRQNLALGAEDGRFSRAGKHLNDYLQSKPMNMTEFKVLDEARKITGQVQRGTIDALEGERRIAALQPKTRAGQKALEQATGILNQGMVNPGRIVSELEKLTKSGNSAVSSSAAAHLATIGKNQDATGWVHARVLDDVRQNIGTMLAQHSPHGAAGSKEGALYGPLKAKIANQIDRALPGYRDSLAAYARAAEPVNTMESVRKLIDPNAPGGVNFAGDQANSAARIKAALRGDDKARYPMADTARAQLEGVRDSLVRRSQSNSQLGPSGPQTAYDLVAAQGLLPRLIFGNGPKGGIVPRAIGTGLGAGAGAMLGGAPGAAIGATIGQGLPVAAGKANSRATSRLAELMANSKRAADALEEEAARRRNAQRLLPLQNLPAYLLPYTQ